MTNTELKWIKEIRDNTKQLERIAERLDVISRQLDRLDRKTENSSEKPNNCDGEWKFKKTFPNDDSEFPMGYLVCSVCGSQHANATPCNYCDNCGAKMKG